MVLGIVGTGELRQEVLDLALEIFETSFTDKGCDGGDRGRVIQIGGGGVI